MQRETNEEMREKTSEETSGASLPQKSNKGWKTVLIVFCCILLFACAVLGALQLGVLYCRNTWSQWSPNYAKEDISALLYKENLTEQEYDTLYRQTGLTKLAINDMRFDASGRNRILRIQNFLFQPHEVREEKFAPYTYMNEMDEFATIARLQDGDIIVTSTTYVSWWRYGHGALVVDGERELLAESLSPGTNSKLTNADNFTYLANFIVLRPKASAEIKKQVVTYAKENLLDIPYDMVTGILNKKNPEKLKGTQCAHLVWYAYKKFGIDLDSNGGAIVKPQDMFLSEQVEVVQAFGFDLDRLWK